MTTTHQAPHQAPQPQAAQTSAATPPAPLSHLGGAKELPAQRLKHRYANQKYAEIILSMNGAAPNNNYKQYTFTGSPLTNVLQCSLNPNYPKTLFYFLCYLGGMNGSAAAAYLGGNIRFLDQDGVDVITSQWIANNPAATNAFGKSIPCIAGAESNDEVGDSLALTVGTPIPDSTTPEPGFFVLKPRLLTGHLYGAAIDVSIGSPPTVAVPYVHLFMGFWQYFD